MKNINWLKIKKILIYSLFIIIIVIFLILSFYAIIFLAVVALVVGLFLWLKSKFIKPKYIESNTKKEIYQFITCPVDTKDADVLDDWKNYCKYYATKDEYELPTYEGSDDDLGALESYYKRLDLYFQFSRKMKKNIQYDELVEKKKNTVHKINKILKETYKDFSKKCNICGKPLPIGYEYGMCQRCFKRRRFY